MFRERYYGSVMAVLFVVLLMAMAVLLMAGDTVERRFDMRGFNMLSMYIPPLQKE